MSKVIENPFINRQMIKNENDFIGRKRELSTIISRLRNGSSVSVVGERRIGKSSLLYHLFLTGNKRLDDINKTSYRLFYIDAHSALFSSPSDFASEIVTAFTISHDAEEVKEKPLKVLTRGLKTFRKSGTLPILLIDEFEKLSEKKAIFVDSFFESLRSCCNSNMLAIVTASQHTLKNLTEKNGLTSPFWNIFYSVPIGGFAVDDDHNKNEVIDFIHRFWDALSPSDEEVLFLLNYGSNHPLVLQTVSFHLYENRDLQLDEKKLKKAIQEELLSYFRDRPEKITRWFRRAGILNKINKGTEYIGKQIKNLGSVLDFFKPGS